MSGVLMTPTPGRVVWFYPAAGSPIPHIPGVALAALVAFVTTERLVNLAVFDMTGAIWPQQDVHFVHEGDVYVTDAARCEWMPYQVGQAKAAAEAKIVAQDDALAGAEANLHALGAPT